MEWEVGSGRVYKKLFKLMRHVREQNPEPERKLKGICKIVAERNKLCAADADEEEQEDECGDEGEQGEEEEMEDDECVDVEDVKKDEPKLVKTPRESPVRRLAQKTAASCEEVLFLGTKKSKEKEELDNVLEKIKLLQIARSDETQPIDINLVETPPSTCRRSQDSTPPAAATMAKGKPLPKDTADLPEVDPFLQKQLRATKKKTLVKGKPKKTPANPKKAAKPKKAAQPKKAAATKDKKLKGNAKGDAAAASKKTSPKNAKAKPPKPDDDVGEGEGERQLGCPTCRFGRLGCKKCRNPNYRSFTVKMGKLLKGKPQRAPVLTTIFTVVAYMPLDYTEEYEAMELFVGQKAVTTTMNAHGLRVASIVWGPDSLDLMCHGFELALTLQLAGAMGFTWTVEYEKKLIWYYCDVAYEGVAAAKDEEELFRETDITESAAVSEVPFGLGAELPGLNSDDEADDDEEDDSDDEAEETAEAKPKLGKRKSKDSMMEQEEPDEDIEGVPDLLDEILKLQSRCKKEASTLTGHIKALMAKHDELADLKSAYDCNEGFDSAMTVLAGVKATTAEPNAKAAETPAPKRAAKSKAKGKAKAKQQVSHEMAAELAHAIMIEVNDSFGDEATFKLKSADIVHKMSTAFSTGHSAAGTRKAIAVASDARLHLSIPVTFLDIGLERKHPALLFSSYVKTLADLGQLEVLHANADLGKFWETMQPLRSGHPVYALPREDWDRVIPVYLIADEGRGLRHSAVMVMGCEPLLGNGCEAQDAATAAEPFKMNFTGNTYRTRQLFSVLHKTKYLKGEVALHRLVTHWSEDLRLCFDGIQLSGTLWRVAVIGLKGDWPALDKLGRLNRHFRREAYPHGQGICHLCMANTAVCPQWHQHCFATLVDFELVGSDKTGVEPSLAFLYEEMKDFAAMKGLYLHMTGLTKKLVGMATSADFPSGTLAFQSSLYAFPLLLPFTFSGLLGDYSLNPL
ncbi:unnamed protein product [Symbiodinium sp. CCMP2456]|nr:unnamed protein product [Symbiodinium sp. CCMP2456]